MATQKKKSKKKPSALKLINLKVSDRDHARMQVLARRFATGNLSAWLRTAGLNFNPNGGRK